MEYSSKNGVFISLLLEVRRIRDKFAVHRYIMPIFVEQMAKIKKHILTFEQSFDFDMIGICSHHNDYRLAWNINDTLKTKLSKADNEYVVLNKKGTKHSAHSLYEYKDEENLIEFYMVKNKVNGNFLIPEKPMIDYFLLSARFIFFATTVQ